MACHLQGLHFLHANGVLHLDVKPDNIYRDADGILKLGDFGLAVLRHQWVRPLLTEYSTCLSMFWDTAFLLNNRFFTSQLATSSSAMEQDML